MQVLYQCSDVELTIKETLDSWRDSLTYRLHKSLKDVAYIRAQSLFVTRGNSAWTRKVIRT
jgi:hypothetical protein